MKATLALIEVFWFVGFTLPALAQDASESTRKAAVAETTEQAKQVAEVDEDVEEQRFSGEFRTLLSQGKFDEAEKQLRAALGKRPDSFDFNLLHREAYVALRRAGRNEQALEHFKAFVLYEIKETAKRGRFAESFPLDLDRLVDFAAQLGGPDRATQTLDDFAKQAQVLPGSTEQIQLAIDAQRALQLGKAGNVDEARSMLEAQVVATSKALDEDPNDTQSILLKAAALKHRVSLEEMVRSGEASAAWSELFEFLHETAQQNPNSIPVVSRFESEHLRRAMMLARNDPDAAEALVDRVEDFLKESEDPGIQSRLQTMSERIATVRGQIEKSRKMLALIGSDAMYPENVDGWVNGDSLTPESLKGKVVLLDFFAVWCGPCIATFPHLREWHDEFADQGLQIIGVTNYYQYGWDEAAGRAARQAEIEPEAERAAMEQFAKHHELRHRIAYVTGRELQDFYAVSGIPHAVVIDRQGKVRLFRIGSGDQNAADLKRAIEECLAESALSQ